MTADRGERKKVERPARIMNTQTKFTENLSVSSLKKIKKNCNKICLREMSFDRFQMFFSPQHEGGFILAERPPKGRTAWEKARVVNIGALLSCLSMRATRAAPPQKIRSNLLEVGRCSAGLQLAAQHITIGAKSTRPRGNFDKKICLASIRMYYNFFTS